MRRYHSKRCHPVQKTFIIDGYNAIHKIPELEARLGESLESARTALAMEISGWRRRYANAEVYIVFDGRDEHGLDYSNTKICGVECIFTRSEESADDHIINMVRGSEDSSAITVISDDNKVRNSCRAHRAQVKYTSFLQKRKKKSRGPVKHVKKIDNTGRGREVTDYYKQYLRRKGAI